MISCGWVWSRKPPPCHTRERQSLGARATRSAAAMKRSVVVRLSLLALLLMVVANAFVMPPNIELVFGRRHVHVSNNRLTVQTRGSRDIGQSVTNDLVEAVATTSSVVATPTSLDSNESSTSIEKERSRLVALLFFVTFLSALDRVAMSVAIIPMSEQLGFGQSVDGLISTSFSLGYMIGIIPTSIFGAIGSPKLLLQLGVGLWSIAQVATPYAASSSLTALYCTRFMMGFAESCAVPTVQAFVSSRIPEQQKSSTLSFILSGMHVGTVAAFLLSPAVIDLVGGWEYIFFIYGAVGLCWMALWSTFAQDAPSTQLKTAASVDLAKQKKPFGAEIPWLSIIRSKEVQAICIAHAAQNFGLYFYLTWLPTYFHQHFHETVSESSLSSVAPWIASAIFGNLAGRAADAVIAKRIDFLDTTRVRKVAQSIALLVPAAALIAISNAQTLTTTEASCYFTLITASASFGVAGFGSSVLDVCKKESKLVSVIYGITSAPAIALGSVSVWSCGQILERLDNDWNLVFQIISAVNVLGALFYIRNYRSKKLFD